MNVPARKSYRLAQATGLAAVVAAFAIPSALALRPAEDGRSPDTRAAAAASKAVTAADGRSANTLDVAIATAVTAHSRAVADGRSPDTRDAAVAMKAPTAADRRSPDTLDVAIATAVTAHSRTAGDGRSPDTRDAAVAAAQGPDQRSPDTRDAAARTRFPIAASPSAHIAGDGIDSGTFRVVAAVLSAMALLLLIGGRAVATRQGRGKGTGSVRAA
jgi:hypothetical protein